jgi:hypothetical protein
MLDDKDKWILYRANRILDVAYRMAYKYAFHPNAILSHLDSFSIHEDGFINERYGRAYASKIVVLGDLNNVEKYNLNTGLKEEVSKLPERMCHLFVALGVNYQWYNEWAVCKDCHKLIRLLPNKFMDFCDEVEDGVACWNCLKARIGDP